MHTEKKYVLRDTEKSDRAADYFPAEQLQIK